MQPAVRLQPAKSPAVPPSPVSVPPSDPPEDEPDEEPEDDPELLPEDEPEAPDEEVDDAPEDPDPEEDVSPGPGWELPLEQAPRAQREARSAVGASSLRASTGTSVREPPIAGSVPVGGR